MVKVLAVSDPPDYEQPWQTQGVTNATGSGVIVSTVQGPRVLTNAHVIQNQVFVEVRRFGRARQYVAAVEGVGHECDLALLSVESPEFFRGTRPIAIGTLPALGERVTALGFPVGGDRLSVTQGVVSRIEMLAYEQSQRRLLGIQIDAAINAGNSGGPIVQDGKLAGIAFQSLDEAENIGYGIAAPVVEHFLHDMADGKFDGFPDLGIVIQKLESDAHRRSLGLTSPTGVLVARVVYEGSAWRVLRSGDVLLEVDGVPVSGDGTVAFRKGARIEYEQVVAQCQMGDTIGVKVSRRGQELTRELKLRPRRYLVSDERYDVKPTYYLFAGLLFVPLSRDYLKTWGDDWPESAPDNLITIYERGLRTRARTEIVMLQKVLADPVNRGYHDFDSLVVARVDGTRIRSLCDLVEIIESSTSPFVHLETQDHLQIVIDREEALERHAAILERYGVPKDRSDDLPSRCVE